MSSYQGRFITLEGIEGAGKSTCIPVVRDYLEKRGLQVTETREPGGTRLGNRVRELLLGTESEAVDPFAELLLFMAARVQHVREVIEPQLQEGIWVLSDRFFDSTLAYQGSGRGLDPQQIHALYELCMGSFKPDLTLLLDVDAATGRSRIKQRGGQDRFEAEETDDFFERVRGGFLTLAAKEQTRYRKVNATKPLAAVRAEITAFLDSFCAPLGLAHA